MHGVANFNTCRVKLYAFHNNSRINIYLCRLDELKNYPLLLKSR